jgi:hypothetical protein
VPAGPSGQSVSGSPEGLCLPVDFWREENLSRHLGEGHDFIAEIRFQKTMFHNSPHH